MWAGRSCASWVESVAAWCLGVGGHSGGDDDGDGDHGGSGDARGPITEAGRCDGGVMATTRGSTHNAGAGTTAEQGRTWAALWGG